jgi:hypothetical protein
MRGLRSETPWGLNVKGLRSLLGKFLVRMTIIAVMFVSAFWFHLPFLAAQTDAKHPFTVKDSIEISYIVNPTASTFIELRETQPIGVPIFSPDRKRFLLITQRGVLSKDSLEATLWLFDRQSVWNYIANKSDKRPVPKAVATLSANSNTPVISEIRWLEDSDSVTFLGKKDSPYQQLFLADLRAGTTRALTKPNAYVTAYAVSGNTIAYSTLIAPERTQPSGVEFIDVTGKGIYSLLYPDASNENIEDVKEDSLLLRPSALHVQRNGKEFPLSFRWNSVPLKLFIPSLSLSPDGKSLITIAPVHKIPTHWAEYQPQWEADFLHLRADNKYALAEENAWKASQYVVIDLQSGTVSSLVDAPAGRGLGYGAPSVALWFADSRRAVLSNTFLPVNTEHDAGDKTERARAPAVAVVDISSKGIQPITFISETRVESTKHYTVADLWLNKAKGEVHLSYEGFGDQAQPPSPETYALVSGKWTKLSSARPGADVLGDNLELSVDQGINEPPSLWGHVRGDASTLMVWDPNPQVSRLSMGKVSVCRWTDKNNNSWSGLLALPPDYDPKQRYPLVIQTHGYNTKRFFADGEYTTGSGGRALASKGMVVFQMDMPMMNFQTPKDGPFAIAGFESAIEKLAADGLVDPRRVGVIGFSYSCFHVLYAITHRPDLFAAASITDGNNMSYVQYIMSTDVENGLQRISEKTNGGTPFGTGLINWAENAPNFALDKVKTPLLISSLGRGELIAQWETYSGLRRLKKPVYMGWLKKENAPHILVKPYQRYISQEGAVDWFSFWLIRQEDPAPAKVEQYARWRDLRRLRDDNQNALNKAAN